MKAVITGGTGFIGSRLVEILIENGYEVRCLVRKSSETEPLKKLGIDLCYGDLSDHDSLRRLTKGGDWYIIWRQWSPTGVQARFLQYEC
jgi:dihydroflavonol-4-reductase